MPLVVISTHPIQYQAPVYRVLQSEFNVPTTVIYGSDFSVAGYHDREFGTTFAWDGDLLQGYEAQFLSRVANGGAASVGEVSANGMHTVLRRLRPDAILLLGYRPRYDLPAFWAARQLGCPLMFRAEAADHAQQRTSAKQLLRDTFLRWYYRQFSQILYIGKNALSHYRRLGCPDSKLVFAPYCVDTSAFQLSGTDRLNLRDETRRALDISADRIVLLMSGKLVSRKAPYDLLQAVKTLPEPLLNAVTVVFLGDGELRNLLENFSSAAPRIETRFVGFQNQSALSRYYHCADLLVMPSIEQETWGLVVNEALHHGLPCIVSDQVGCAADLVQPGVTGEIFTAGSPDALAAAIQQGLQLIGDPIIRERCADLVSHYTVEKAAQGIALAYYTAIGSTQ